jgi:polyphosphate kinase
MNEKERYINREISWLSFNERVLQEASDPRVPLIERVRFLGIYSNNMDEFFRVRVATIRRLKGVGREARNELMYARPKILLKEISTTVKKLHKKFESVFKTLLRDLQKENIFILNEKNLNEEQQNFAVKYFHEEVRPKLVPIMLSFIKNFPRIKEGSIHLAINIKPTDPSAENMYSIIEIPDTLNRFVELPSNDGKKYLILLDDIIRLRLDAIFHQFDYSSIEAYTIKITRDAELDFDNDISKSLIEKIEKSVEARKKGDPVRFVYDQSISADLLKFLIAKMQMQDDENKIAGGRYHNFKDFMSFPTMGKTNLTYAPIKILAHPAFKQTKLIFETIEKQDVLLHYPYQRFSYLIDFLREAAMDPYVTTIKMTLYRVANHSMVANSLINAAKNGKRVVAVVELQARFDEESNIYWAKKMQEEGVNVIYGVPGLKVHSKLCLVTRVKDGVRTRFCNFSTGNFNEKTARIYSDTALFTADERLTYEANKVFQFFQNNYKVFNFKHLIVSPHYSRNKFYELIDNEIKNAKAKKPAYIFAKMNSLVDTDIIDKLYFASQQGVKIKLIVRGSCSIIPGKPGLSENIEAISIIDKFLEHSRVYIFCNGGKEKYFLSSADWMQRNLDFRVEVTFPIYDTALQKELKDFMDIQWSGNTKVRILDESLSNQYRKAEEGEQPVRVQFDFYDYLAKKLEQN